jgi:putative acetyltransferase
MIPTITLRPETSTDIDTIHDVTVAAFATLEISGHTEQFIVAALRAAKALSVSLIAEIYGRVRRARSRSTKPSPRRLEVAHRHG